MNSKNDSKLTVINNHLKPKTKKQTKPTTRTGTEPQKWSSHGGLSTGEWEGEKVGKGTENKQHKWQVENRQGEGKNSIRNVEAKELICMTHGHELQGGEGGREGVCRMEWSEEGEMTQL